MKKFYNYWFKLDNSAKIYPFMVEGDVQNSFRLSCTLKESINKDILQESLEEVISRFPTFSVKLKKGVFWYYLEPISRTPIVQEESPFLLPVIDDTNCQGYNFRVSYFNKRINLDIFHIIADGYGGTEFLKSLVYTYLKRNSKFVLSQNRVILPQSPIDEAEVEDSFIKFKQNKSIKELDINSLKGKTAYKINGILLPQNVKGLIEGTMNIHDILKLSRSYNCSLTEFITATILYSIYETKLRDYTMHESLQVFLPINLRKHFKSRSLRNFTLFSRVGVDVGDEKKDFNYFIESIKNKLREDLKKESLQSKINTMVKAESIIFTRLAPLHLKNLIFKISNIFFGKNKKTFTFSNLGIVELPDSFKDYVDSMSFNINVNKKTNFAVSALTCFDTFKISFSRKFTDTSIEKYFFKLLMSKGIDVTIYSNYGENAYEMS